MGDSQAAAKQHSGKFFLALRRGMRMTTEIVIVPTYKREELLHACLERIRKYEPDIRIEIFPDRGTFADDKFMEAAGGFGATAHTVPQHPYYGNTTNTMEALRLAYEAEIDRVFYIESDVMVHADFFSWHREMQEEFPDIFASMAWVFNRHAPIDDSLSFQPWYYAVGTCFSRNSLARIAKHATPAYYRDMRGYIQRNFPGSHLNSPFGIMHFEQDGLIQRVLGEKKGDMTVSAGRARCTHMGFVRSYGDGTNFDDYDMILGPGTFAERCAKLEALIADPYWRAKMFAREVVEREEGHILEHRELRYRLRIGEWESEFTSELTREVLPPRINSVRVPPGASVELIG